MKKPVGIFMLFALLMLPALSPAQNASGLAGERFLFFLHNKFLELYDVTAVHPEYGRAEYAEILNRFRQAGFHVISEKRPANTDVTVYARKVVTQIDSLLRKGVKPGNISVVGTSKGGYIAQYVSTYLKNPAVNFVFVGCYQDSDLVRLPEINFCGNILSIYEKSDPFGVAAVKRKEASRLKVSGFKELELHTHLKHGFLYHPLDEWMLPAIQWAGGNYDKLCAGEIKLALDSILKSAPGKPFSGVILIREGADVVYSNAFGYARKEDNAPLTPNSQFVIGSISKQFTAVLLLLELQKGRLKLNDRISKYLPQLARPWKDSVTVYQLLTHSHGILSRDEPLAFRPGTATDYERGNNIGYQLLSEIIGKTSGKHFSRLSMELFRRCGMEHTFHPDVKGYKNLAAGYTQGADGRLAFDSQSFQASPAAGAFISTAGDLVTWNEWLHGGKILKPETYALMTTLQPHIVRQHPVWGATEYGLGLTIRDKENILQLGQTGFAPGFVSMNFYFPETKLSAVVLQNVAYHSNKSQDVFYYHVQITEMLRSMLKGGKEVAEKKRFIRGSDTLPYRLIYPVAEDLTKKYPLIVYLHGSGARGADNEQVLQKLPAAFLDSTNRSRHPAFILLPQCPASDMWVKFPNFPNQLSATDSVTEAARLSFELIRHLIETKDIDPARIYLTGFSMGGEGTFDFLSREPGLFACAVPLASVADTAKARAISHIPVWAFHGDADKVNDVRYTTMMVEALQQAGRKPLFTKLAVVQHNCQAEAYGNPDLWKWMFEQHK